MSRRSTVKRRIFSEKNIRLPAQLAIVSLTSLAAYSCAAQKKHHQNNDTPQRFFLHGDPLKLIEGTAQNPNTFLTEGNLHEFDSFEFAGGIIFTELSRIKAATAPATGADLENQNSTSENSNESEIFAFRTSAKLSPEGFTRVEYVNLASGKRIFSGVLEPDSDPSAAKKLRITELYGYEAKVLHYSLVNTKHAFSLLAAAQSAEFGAVLMSAAFTKRSAAAAANNVTERDRALDQFSLIGGPGSAYQWRESSIELSFCLLGNERDRAMVLTNTLEPQGASTGTREPRSKVPLVQLVEMAWSAWQKPGGRIGQKNARFKVLEAPPPFSDLETNCLYSIPEYAAENSLEFYQVGVTVPVTARSESRFVSSDIFLFEKAISKAGDNRDYLSTAIHELGHFLGLGHEFRKDSDGKYKFLSVMGYLDNRTAEPSELDLAAVEALYSRNH